MEITNFLNAESLITFTMSLVMVELWVNFTKEWFVIKKLPTKLYTLILAIVHLAVINVEVGLFSMTAIGVYTLLCNALIVSVILCGGFDIITGKITFNKEQITK